MFKQILKSVASAIGWKKLLLVAWEIADDDLKAKAAKTPTKVDDQAVALADIAIRALCADESLN